MCPAEKGPSPQGGCWVCSGHPDGEPRRGKGSFSRDKRTKAGFSPPSSPRLGLLTAVSSAEQHDIPQLPCSDNTFYLYQTPLFPGEHCVFPTLIQ